jgi:hypothetical protein
MTITEAALPVRGDVVSWKATDSGEISGYLSVFNHVDQEDDVVMPGAFADVIDEWRRSGEPMPLLADHDRSTGGVIGRVVELVEDRIGVKFRARFASTPKAQDVRTKVLEGHVKGVSYGYVAGRRPGWHQGRAVKFIDRIEKLFEVTISPWPVNRLAAITSAKAGAAWPTMPLPAASEVVTVAETIRRSHEALARAEMQHKARWLEAHGWPGSAIVEAVGVERAYEMAMTAYEAARPEREAAEERKATARAQARAEVAWQRGYAEIHQRAAQPCGRCRGCRHQLGQCDYR